MPCETWPREVNFVEEGNRDLFNNVSNIKIGILIVE